MKLKILNTFSVKVYMMQEKNYNRLALQGWKITDEEIIKKYNIDPIHANTPQINDEILNVIYKKDYETFKKDGLSEEEAARLAKDLKLEAEHEIKLLLGDY